MINEPTAAAVCYAVERSHNNDQTFMIYDFGGGTFDCTILKVSGQGKKFKVLASEGNARLGGRDLDKIVIDKLMDLIEKEEK